MIGGWIARPVFSGATRESGGGGVAYWARVGGAVAGLILVWLRNPRVQVRADFRAQGPSNYRNGGAI